MTEKRFYFSKCCGICDNDKGESDFTNMLHSDEVVDLLNALHEDLETEKQKNRALKTILGCTKMRLKKIIGELE